MTFLANDNADFVVNLPVRRRESLLYDLAFGMPIFQQQYSTRALAWCDNMLMIRVGRNERRWHRVEMRCQHRVEMRCRYRVEMRGVDTRLK